MGIFEVPKKSLFLLFIFCQLTGSNKIAVPDKSGTSKLSTCRRCKILTDSFKHWLDKTSRGKFEGGDAAWEEAKLKSYSRSEIRLTEIQEGLCSEVKIHQDACYAIAEEAEQILEKWWFNQDPGSEDLYTWLCIESLKDCCPSKHYGSECAPCPMDKSNKVCGGHGRCNGAGTRQGNGTCICKKGYTGEMCEDCEKNFYQTSTGACDKCDKSCNGCIGGDAASCESCNSGWQLQSGVCVDVNECETSVCTASQYCINTEGSYSCQECESSCQTCSGEGPSNCTSCDPDTVLWFGMCVSSEQKQKNVIETYKRIAQYVGLLTIVMYMAQKSRFVASIVALIIAIVIFYLEKTNLRNNTIDVTMQILQEFYSKHTSNL